jgi:hypothetical protein
VAAAGAFIWLRRRGTVDYFVVVDGEEAQLTLPALGTTERRLLAEVEALASESAS